VVIVIHPEKSQDDFNKFILELAELVCRHGINIHVPEADNKLSFQYFRNKVHEGWKLAQDKACGELLQYLDEKSLIESKIKERNHNRQKESTKFLQEAIAVIESRIRRIQYVFNTIPWTLFNMEDYVIRRFYRGETQNNINRKSLAELYAVADEFNKKESEVAIMCDLTTFMHVGDLLIVRSVDGQERIQLAEVKQGKRNSEMLEIQKSYIENGCDRYLYYATKDFDEKDRKQFKRILNQKVTMAQVQEVLETDKGIDLATGKPIQLGGDGEFVPPTYCKQINEAYETLNQEKEWAIGVVDECLFFGMYKGKMLSAAPFMFDTWMKYSDIKGPIVSYASSFYKDTARPILTQPISGDLIEDLLTGKIVIFICVDFSKLVHECNEAGIPARLESKKESKRMFAKMKQGVMYDDQMVAMGVDGFEMYLGGGTFHRMVYSFNCPIDLLRQFAADAPKMMKPESGAEPEVK
jgi:hypothetical protein